MAKESQYNRDEALDEAVQEFLAAQLRGEEPDLEAFVQQYPGLEERIRGKVRACQRVGSLFDSIRQPEESEFPGSGDGGDLVGQRLGPFEITEIIGRGGMGIVYKGRDTRLDRTVAIKAMPSHLVEDSTARARFKREATLLASLNHANIGVLYDIIGQKEEAGYLVLEYIPGETLAERIARGTVEVQDALSVALQIAEAVAAAHERGVIHRDLKPGNMMITPDGKVRVLDFGLARAVGREVTTAETAVTQLGRVVGTPAYMSPEQARGQAADHRTDIWSFGCVLYEMLTGHLVFEGETATDTLARVIEREPDWRLLPQATPSSIRVLLRRCLAKGPRRRLQHMGDVVLELEEALNVPADEPSLGEPEAKVAGRPRWGLGIACAVAGLIPGLIVAGVFLSRSVPSSPDSVAAVIRLPENQVLEPYQSRRLGSRLPAFAVSPDGSCLVYAARVADTTQLFERRMGQYEAKPIPGTVGASSPFFSPDGAAVGFFADDKLRRISLLGGEPVTLSDTPYLGTGSWGDDGMIYFTGGEGGLSRVPARGGDRELLGPTSDPVTGSYPQVLPDGRSLLVSSRHGAVLVSLETMEERLLVKGVLHARYVPTGHLVYARAGAIEAVPFSLAKLEPTGPAVPVIPNVLLDSVYGLAHYTFSDSGLLVYVVGRDTAKSRPVWVDRQGKKEPLDMEAQYYGSFKLSPDGTRLAISVNEQKRNIYIYDLTRGTATRLTSEGSNNCPLWTPDGERVVFSRYEEAGGQWHIVSALADGRGEAELLCSSDNAMTPYSWSSDGRLLGLYEFDRLTGHRLCVVPREGGDKPRAILKTKFDEWHPSFSPDGQHMAYTSDRDGSFQIYVGRYPALTDWRERISVESGEDPVWSVEGDRLFYRNGDKWMQVSISTEPEFDAGIPEVVFEGRYFNVAGISYDIAPDGQRFLVLESQHDDSEVRELRVVTNWFEELKRLAPASDAQ